MPYRHSRDVDCLSGASDGCLTNGLLSNNFTFTTDATVLRLSGAGLSQFANIGWQRLRECSCGAYPNQQNFEAGISCC